MPSNLAKFWLRIFRFPKKKKRKVVNFMSNKRAFETFAFGATQAPLCGHPVTAGGTADQICSPIRPFHTHTRVIVGVPPREDDVTRFISPHSSRACCVGVNDARCQVQSVIEWCETLAQEADEAHSRFLRRCLQARRRKGRRGLPQTHPFPQSHVFMRSGKTLSKAAMLACGEDREKIATPSVSPSFILHAHLCPTPQPRF
jgi:hypothetical protein